MKIRIRNNQIGAATAAAFRFRREATGSAVVEFALLAPVLFLLLIGMFQFGILINNYIQVTEATRVGGRTLAISRGSSTPIASTKAAVYASAPGLAQGSFGFTLGIAGNTTDCVSNETTCKNRMDSNQGNQATLTVSYACGSLVVYGTNFFPNCSLSSTTSMRIE